ncbi:glycosyltransferase family 4 protein [Salicibibacter cibi]|uniref:Glycosyltransferase family 4 protein n=1 Tax=Salicibibacter cibi TaxID=2743001 RepID=A0A7T7CG50_9BACI|nr:glycosyltransferase family 4 protein [Salicibibacter cibi]QQK80837.1 glycosyltransferase family 4 protein [Salicibibacter cibi]
MKILYVINKSTDGGVVSTTRSRINAFRKKGIEAEVFFLYRGDGAKMFENIRHYHSNRVKDFQERVTKGGYDCVIFVYSLNYLKHLPSSYKGKKVYELRGWTTGAEKQVSKKNISKSVDAIICIAHYIVPLVRPYFRKDIPIFVDGNTVDSLFYYVNDAKKVQKAALKPQKGHAVIAFVGRITTQKNWKEFIRIFRNISDEYQVEAWFVSNPKTSSDLQELHRICNNNHVNYKVFHVYNENMPEVYSTIADSGGCVLSTSIREGLGNSILEPMACQCPVVSSDKPGKNEIISHQSNGMLYELGNIKKGTGCVEKLLKDAPFRNTMIKNALSTIQRNYNQDVYVDRYLDIVTKI